MEVLEEVREGRFALELRSEKASGYRRLEPRATKRKTLLEQSFQETSRNRN